MEEKSKKEKRFHVKEKLDTDKFYVICYDFLPLMFIFEGFVMFYILLQK